MHEKENTPYVIFLFFIFGTPFVIFYVSLIRLSTYN